MLMSTVYNRCRQRMKGRKERTRRRRSRKKTTPDINKDFSFATFLPQHFAQATALLYIIVCLHFRLRCILTCRFCRRIYQLACNIYIQLLGTKPLACVHFLDTYVLSFELWNHFVTVRIYFQIPSIHFEVRSYWMG